jgi:hypothetical protein
MADTINLSDVSTKDDSKLKTGGRRKHNMTEGEKGEKLSYKSYSSCLESASTDSSRLKCAKHFKKKDAGMKVLSPDEVKEYKKSKQQKKSVYKVKKRKAIAEGAI